MAEAEAPSAHAGVLRAAALELAQRDDTQLTDDALLAALGEAQLPAVFSLRLRVRAQAAGQPDEAEAALQRWARWTRADDQLVARHGTAALGRDELVRGCEARGLVPAPAACPTQAPAAGSTLIGRMRAQVAASLGVRQADVASAPPAAPPTPSEHEMRARLEAWASLSVQHHVPVALLAAAVPAAWRDG